MNGHVYMRGKTYTYVIDLPVHPVTKRRRQKSKGGFKTEPAAWAACYKEIEKIEKGIHTEETKLTVAEYLDEYLKTHAKPNFKPTSYDTEKTIIEARIKPELGKIRLQKLTPREIKTFYAKLRESYSKEYVKSIHGVLKRALRIAYSESGLLAEDIMSKISMRSKVKSNEKNEMKFWSVEEFTHFLSNSKGHVHYIVFSLAIYTGMRRGEVLGLRWSDIDFENRELKVIQTVNWTRSGVIFQRPKTEDSIRRVKLFQFIIDDLLERREKVLANKERFGSKYANHDLVCCYENGEPIKPKRITEGFDVLTRKSGSTKIRFHDLRHTHASFLLKIGINPKVAAERLGMTPAMFNERYSHLLPTMQDEAADRIENELNKIMNRVHEPVDK